MKNKKKSKNYEKALLETKQAYADCNDLRNGRDLDFCCSVSVTPQEAADIMKEACYGYNNFEYSLLLKLPAKCCVTLAREGSVCIYVSGKLSTKILNALGADECDEIEKNSYRIWWD
jgi:hypothetical protein